MKILQLISSLSFREAVWLFPLAFALHVAEELPRFTIWANRFASPHYTFREYLIIHVAGLLSALIAATILHFFPNKILLFGFFAFMFAPGMFFNIFFHAGATLAFRAYCPGLITALTVYPPTVWLVTKRAATEGLLGGKALFAAFILAGLFHIAEVSHNVFKAW
jgi:hypothetical protein